MGHHQQPGSRRGYTNAKGIETPQKHLTKGAIKHIRSMAQRRFAQLLLARVLLLNLFSRRLKTLQGGYEQEEHRRLWVLLQVQPDIFCNGDIFTDVSKHLRGAPIDDLRALIFVESRKNTPPCGQAFAIPQPSKIRLLHFSSVLDEVQITVSGPSGTDG